VGNMGAGIVQGPGEGGVLAAVRSFPGKGEAAARPGLPPLVTTPRETLLERDLSPFRRAIQRGAPLVTVSDAVYPSLDPEGPAMFSSKIARELLRRDLAFGGVAVTEDLTDRSVPAPRPADEAAVAALEAGNDLCLLAHGYDHMKRAARGIRAAVEDGRLPRGPYEESRLRLRTLLGRKRPGHARPEADPEEHEAASALAGRVAEAAVQIERDPQHLLPLEPGRRVGILVPRLGDVADRMAIDEELRGAASLIQGWVRARSSGTHVLEIPVQPEPEMLALALDWASDREVVVVLCFDAHQYPGQRRMLEELQRRSPKVVLVLIGNPWDRAFAKGGTSIVNPCGFRLCQLSAAVRLLFGKPGAPS